MQDFQDCPNLYMVNTRTSAGISDIVWLSGEQNLLAASDSGELEIWKFNPFGNSLEQQGSLVAHDDMALCVCLLGGMVVGGDKVASGGADGRWAYQSLQSVGGGGWLRVLVRGCGGWGDKVASRWS